MFHPQPFLTKYTKIHDSCGVNNLHGMPGIFGGIAGAIAAAHADADKYVEGRTAKAQAGYQIAGLAVSLAIAVIGGIVTGNEFY